MKLTIFILLLSVWGLNAATYNSNGSLSDVQAKVNGATDGDTVTIPVGTFAWGGNLSVNNGIILQGAGTNSTVINASGVAVVWTVGTGVFPRLTGITFDGGVNQIWSGVIQLSGGCQAFRLDHCILRNMDGWCVVVRNLIGLIDHCSFQSYRAGIQVFGHGEGNEIWAQDAMLGTTNALYVENCYFNSSTGGNGAIDAYSSRWVVRYSTIINDNLTGHGAEPCNSPGDSSRRGTRAIEAYLNTMSASEETAVELRSGTGVIWSNSLSSYGTSARFKVYRLLASGVNENCSPWFTADGTAPYDGNTDSVGYPAIDMPGRGKGDLLSDANPPLPSGWPHQQSEPVYVWGNIQGGVTLNSDATWAAALIHEGRDFSNNVAMPGYTPLVYPHPLIGGGGSGAPAITGNPSGVTNFSGTALSLTVSASGTAPLAYQWRQNTNAVSGQTSSTFGSNNVQTTSSGWYDCVVTNASGSVTSSVAYVQITNAPPTIVYQPTGQTISVGDSIILSTVATGSTPLSYQWRLNSAAISGATSLSYTTNNAQTNNSGSYTCVVTNNYGSITTDVASVTVQLDLSPHLAAWWTNSAVNFNSYTTAVVVSGSKPMLVAFVDSYSAGGNKVTNVTFNSVNLTRLFRTNYFSANGALDIWFLMNPAPASANLVVSGTAVAESMVIVGLATNAPTAWALFEPPQANYYPSGTSATSDTINQPSHPNELVLDAVVSTFAVYVQDGTQTLINRVTQSTQTQLQASWKRSLGVYTPMTWGTLSPDTITHVSVAIAQALPTALPTKLTISNVRVSNIKIP